MNPHRTVKDEHPIKQPPPETSLKTEVVENIPVHAQAGAQPTHIKDGDDMDEIMQQVGSELKKDDHKPSKRHWFSKKPHKDVNFQAAPVQRHHDLNAPTPTHQLHTASSHPAQPKPSAKTQPLPKAKSSAPVLVITITVIVTGILIAAAISAYRN